MVALRGGGDSVWKVVELRSCKVLEEAQAAGGTRIYD
jgi:hypothetical protein